MHFGLARFCINIILLIIIIITVWASATDCNVHSALSETNQSKLLLSRSPAITTRGGRWGPANLMPYTLRVIKSHQKKEQGGVRGWRDASIEFFKSANEMLILLAS